MQSAPSRPVDGHAHVFLRALPAATRPRYLPDYDAAPQDYLAVLDAHGIAGAILVQPSFLGYRNDFLLDCLGRYPDRFRGVVVLDEHNLDDTSDLETDGVVGMRVNAIGTDVPDLTTRAWQRIGSELARRGQHLEVQACGRQWSALAPVLATWPSPVVIDHLGLPGAAPEADQLVLDLARHDHIWVKVSAPYRSPRAAAAAMLARLLDEAGTARLLWGSDWPWTRHETGRDYADCLRWPADHIDGAALRTILTHNPSRLIDSTFSALDQGAPAPATRI